MCVPRFIIYINVCNARKSYNLNGGSIKLAQQTYVQVLKKYVRLNEGWL